MITVQETAGAAAPTATPVCAIGASAGGVEALQAFFGALACDLGLAYVVVVHLAPDHPSHLAEILAARTAMPVRSLEPAIRLARDHVYVVPPDRELAIDGDTVTARPFAQPRGRRATIDLVFRSVAAGRGDGVAIVLSGAGTDGTIGARAVKEAGGLVFVQDPEEASHPTMPRSVLATGAADVVAPAAELARRLGRLYARPNVGHAVAQVRNQDEVPRLVEMVRKHTGHDLSGYKRATLLRRTARRMQVTHRETLADYVAYVEADPDEARALFDDLMISVTTFFRDPAAFDVLRERALTAALAGLGEGDELRAWVIGCATGEEVYSLAILLLEELQRQRRAPPIQIFATDLDHRALAVARDGRYPKAIEADVPEDLLRRYFTDEGEFYRVCAEARDLVLFASNSVLEDPPFLRLDLISCRNLLIYLEHEVQRQLQSLFHYALKPGGYLFLGSAETIDDDKHFELVDRDARLYRARVQSERIVPSLPRLPALSHPRVQDSAVRPARQSSTVEHVDALERSAPASVLVDDRYAVVHFSPGAGRFCSLPGGPFTADISTLVRRELQGDLRRGLLRAFELGEPTLTFPLPVEVDGTVRRVALHVSPLARPSDDSARRALVFFLDGGPLEVGEPSAGPAERDEADRGRELRAELAAAQERLQVSRQEHFATEQELRAANEELHSINEEYRSTSEELETSREELQSMNEELQTVNAELRSKLDAIAAANSNLHNLIEATDIGTLFLDTGLRIRLFTPKVAELFNVAQSDVGRAITDFTHHLVALDLEAEAGRVLRSLAPVERDVSTQEGGWLRVRVRPYLTLDNRIDGVVATFVDVTDQRETNAAVQQSEERFRALITAAADVIYRMTPDWSEMRELQGRGFLTDTAAPRRDWMDFYIPEEDRPRVSRAIEAAIRTKSAFQLEHRVRRSDGSVGWAASRAVPILDAAGDVVEWFGCAADVTEQRRSEERLRAARDALALATSAAGLGLGVLDLASGTIEWDTRGREIVGLRADESHLDDWLARIHPDDRARVEAELDVRARDGARFDLTYRVVHRDGAVRTVQGTGVFERAGGAARAIGFLRDVTERRRAEAEQRSRVEELGRRIAGILPAVQGIAAQAQRTAGGGEAFIAAFDRRLQALGAVQELLVQHDGGMVPLAELARAVRASFSLDQGDRVKMDGPAAALGPDAAVQAALVLHELGADSVAHGALAAPDGRIELTWRVEAAAGSETGLVLTWCERHRTPDAARVDELGAALEHAFGCRVEAETAGDGLAYSVRLPSAGVQSPSEAGAP